MSTMWEIHHSLLDSVYSSYWFKKHILTQMLLQEWYVKVLVTWTEKPRNRKWHHLIQIPCTNVIEIIENTRRENRQSNQKPIQRLCRIFRQKLCKVYWREAGRMVIWQGTTHCWRVDVEGSKLIQDIENKGLMGISNSRRRESSCTWS